MSDKNTYKSVKPDKFYYICNSINELTKIFFVQGNFRLCDDTYESYNDRINQELAQSPAGQIVYS